MSKILGFINLYDSPSLGELTKNRTLGSTSFLGRFALMDFALSNFTNSGIDSFGILVKDNFRSVSKHCGSMKSWVLNTKKSIQHILINEKAIAHKILNTDLANIRENDWIFYDCKADLIVVQPGHIVSSMDLRPIIKQHENKKADITLVYTSIKNAHSSFSTSNIVNIEDGEVKSFEKNIGKKRNGNVSLETYIINADILAKMLKMNKADKKLTIKKAVEMFINDPKYKINAYEYEGYVRCFDSFKHFMDYSFELFDYSIASSLFKKGWKVYTISHNTPPVVYDKTAEVKNSLVANGSVVKGKIENSVLSRYVKVEEGAVIKDSVILTSTKIGKNAVVEHAFIDKYSRISDNAIVKGTKTKPLYLGQGSKR